MVEVISKRKKRQWNPVTKFFVNCLFKLIVFVGAWFMIAIRAGILTIYFYIPVALAMMGWGIVTNIPLINYWGAFLIIFGLMGICTTLVNIQNVFKVIDANIDDVL